jgi:hypothetical protein
VASVAARERRRAIRRAGGSVEDPDRLASDVDGVEHAVAVLGDAAARQALVRVFRAFGEDSRLDGFVVGVDPAWTVLALLRDGMRLDGYAAVRTADVVRVSVRVGREPFAVRALKRRGGWPPVPPAAMALGSLADVLAMAAANAPIVDLQAEQRFPGDAYLGVVTAIDGETAHLLEVSAEADWYDEPTPYATADVTRVEFAGDYEDAVYLVAGDPPVTP